MPVSINGWPVIKSYGSKQLKSGVVKGTKVKFTLRKEVLPLFLALAKEYNETIAPLDGKPQDDWSYNYRTSRYSSNWSNHSSGTAVDLNSAKEGSQSLSNRKYWEKPDKAKAVKKLKRVYSIMNWGGDWSDKYYDPMHWELKAGTSVSDVARLIKKLGITPDGVRTKSRFGIPLKIFGK